jgi:DNA-binding SARP family transcriptional activator
MTGPANLRLTSEFALTVSGSAHPVPRSTERVLAYLALAGRPVTRGRLAGTLWSDSAEPTAGKSLRTALWRLHRAGVDIVDGADRLRLDPAVTVDVTDLADLARRLIRQPDLDVPGGSDLDGLDTLIDAVDVLPDWDDHWVVADRERFRLLRLEALESAGAALARRGRLGPALIVALATVQADPLRESARRLLIGLQVARGNVAEAIRCYQEYARMLRVEFRAVPSDEMRRLIQPLVR